MTYKTANVIQKDCLQLEASEKYSLTFLSIFVLHAITTIHYKCEEPKSDTKHEDM